jgi:hypothetical protein
MAFGTSLNRRLPTARIFAALLALCFTVQTYLIQTHVHPLPERAKLAASLGTHAPTKAPADNDDPDNCPICQAFALSGNFDAPAIIILPMATLVASADSITYLFRHWVSLSGHAWKSRAPPQA